MLDSKNLCLTLPTKKLSPWLVSPFKIVRIINKLAVKLELPTHWRKHNVFHVSYLTKVSDDLPISQDVNTTVNPDQDFKVKEILKRLKPPKNCSYILKWKNYPVEDATWLKAKDCTSCSELVKEYKEGLKERIM